jgi:hypothetical protein
MLSGMIPALALVGVVSGYIGKSLLQYRSCLVHSAFNDWRPRCLSSSFVVYMLTAKYR